MSDANGKGNGKATGRKGGRGGRPRHEAVVAEKALTSGQVASACGVAARTVSKWIDSGRLPGFRLPGSEDRRVYWSDVVEFCRASGIRLPGLAADGSRRRVAVCVPAPPAGWDAVGQVELGSALVRREVAEVLVGCADGLSAAVSVGRAARAAGGPGVRVVLLLAADRRAADVPGGVFDAVTEGGG